MKSTTKTYFVVMQILDLLLGILLCVAPAIVAIMSIAGTVLTGFPISAIIVIYLPIIFIAIFVFKASSKFKKARNYSNAELIAERKSLLGWGIFSAIMLAPSILGLVIILIFTILVNNYILDLERDEENKESETFGEVLGNSARSAGNVIKDGAKATVDGTKEVFGIKSEMQKQKEQLEELKSWKDEGFLTEEEYNLKRRQILNID